VKEKKNKLGRVKSGALVGTARLKGSAEEKEKRANTKEQIYVSSEQCYT